MRYRSLLLIGLLMFLILAGFFFYNIRDLFYNIEEELLTYLEKTYQIKVEIGSFFLWPVNQITLKEVKIDSLENNFSISTPEFTIYYNIFSFLTSGNLAASLNHVNMDSPILEIVNRNEGLPADNVGNFNINDFFHGWIEKLYSPSPFQLRINDGKLSYSDKENQLSIGKINLLLKVPGEEECQIKLDSNLYIDKFQWQKYQIDKVNINNVQFTISLDKESWQGVIESEYIDLAVFAPYLSEIKLPGFNIDKLNGQVKPVVVFSGNKGVLEYYNSTLSLENTQGEFTISNKAWEEKVYLDNLIGNFIFDSEGDIIYTEGIEFILNENQIKLSGRIDNTFTDKIELVGHLKSNNFAPGRSGLLPDGLLIDGIAAMDIFFEGSPSNLHLNFDLSMAEGSINNIRLGNLVARLRYNQGNIYLNQLNFILEDTGQLSLNGIYNNREDYSFNLEGHYIDLELLEMIGVMGIENPDSLYPVELNGKLNIMANLTGHGLDINNLIASGEMELVEPEVYLPDNYGLENNFHFNQMKSRFYLVDQSLFIQDGGLSTNWGELAFSGEIGLIGDKDINLEFNSDSISIAGLINELGLDLKPDPGLTGGLEVTGLIKDRIDSPSIELALFSKEGSFYGTYYNDLRAKLNYFNKELSIEEISMNYHDTLIHGEAIMNLSERSEVSGLIYSKNLDFKTITNIFAEELSKNIPLKGDLEVGVAFAGPVDQPELSIYANSKNLSLLLDEQEIAIDNFAFNLERQEGVLLLEEMVLTQGDASFSATGVISGEDLNLDYYLVELSLADFVDSLLNERVEGKLNLTGEIGGSLTTPAITGKLDIQDLDYQKKALGVVKGNLYYYAGDFSLDRLIWKNQQQEYIIDGTIKKILSEPYFDLTLNTGNGQIKDFVFLDLNPDIEEILLKDYYISGDGHLIGQLDNISAWLDFNLIDMDNQDSKIHFLGSVYPDLDLLIEGTEIRIDKILQEYSSASIAGGLAINGELTGSLDSFQLVLDTQLTDTVIEDTRIENIQGRIDIREGSLLTIQQVMTISEDNIFQVKGSIDLKGEDSLNLNLDLEKFPLELLSSYSSSLPDMAGLLSGNLVLVFAADQGDITGELYLLDGGLDLNLPDNFTELTGNINFHGETISLEGLSGRYGTGQILVQGLIKPFAEDSNLELNITGKELPFAHGSINGKFDGSGEITGLLEEPLVKAELLAHDLNVTLPFDWPVSDGGNNWKLDLLIYPGDEVYLTNDNINVLIQEGNLKLQNLDNQLDIIGELTSTQGTFDFYNNKFFLENGQAKFEKSFIEKDRYTPQVNITAWTNIGGTRIDVQLSGKANNMMTTFTSLPPLSEEEILTLLTSRGGIGEFISGNLEDVIQSEFFRWLHNQIQLDYVTDIQETLRNVFELDRLEVDTYNWRWTNQVSLYIGKHLNSRLYLEYADIIGGENTPLSIDNGRELRLQYFLDENIILEGSWQGDEEYSLSIETKYQF